MVRSDTPMMKLALATLLSSAHALVAEPRGDAFSLDAIAAPARRQFSPEAEFEKLQSRFPITAPLAKRQTDPAAQQGSIAAHPKDPNDPNDGYFSPVVIGNQTFRMILDTGSADLWVLGNSTYKSQGPDFTYYFPSSSATLLQGQNWTIQYQGQATAGGSVYTDVVKVGDVVAEKQAVQMAETLGSYYEVDGIMGLSFSIINQVKPTRQKTFFETVAPTLKRKVFAANLRPDGTGSWDFGHIDKSKYTGDIVYTPEAGNGKHWTMVAGEYKAGDVGFNGATLGNVTLDSGSVLLYVADEVLENYYKQIPGYEPIASSHVFPCNATMPDFNFKVEDKWLSLPGKHISYSTWDPRKNLCVGALTSKENLKFSVFGSIFMKAFYVVHSMEDDVPKIGLAPQA